MNRNEAQSIAAGITRMFQNKKFETAKVEICTIENITNKAWTEIIHIREGELTYLELELIRQLQYYSHQKGCSLYFIVPWDN